MALGHEKLDVYRLAIGCVAWVFERRKTEWCPPACPGPMVGSEPIDPVEHGRREWKDRRGGSQKIFRARKGVRPNIFTFGHPTNRHPVSVPAFVACIGTQLPPSRKKRGRPEGLDIARRSAFWFAPLADPINPFEAPYHLGHARTHPHGRIKPGHDIYGPLPSVADTPPCAGGPSGPNLPTTLDPPAPDSPSHPAAS